MPNIKPNHSFTVEYQWLINTPHVEVSILDDKNNLIEKCTALFDTWAQCSCIDESFAEKLKIDTVWKSSIKWVWGKRECPVFFTKIGLPNQVVIECKLMWVVDIWCQIIIGMDIIWQWDFAISQNWWHHFLSFRMPSQWKLCFVSEISKNQWLWRNDLCWCNSGKKYKKCCWK